MPAYVEALLSELEMRRHEIESEALTTIYLGGGTPSSLPVGQLSKLMEGIAGRIDISSVTEITLEVNPEDVSTDFLKHIKSLGFNRISMGVQSLNDDELRTVGRRHTASEAIAAIDRLAEEFDNYSLDIIFGLPQQTLQTLDSTLGKILSFRPPHLSAYLLSYEPGTRLYAALMASKIAETPEADAELMYRTVTSRLAETGYQHYEISNYSLPGFHSRHNSAYWTMAPYLGLGASAHSYDGAVRRYNPSSIKAYLEAIKDSKCCYIIDEEAEWQRFNDLILVSLRTSAGFPLEKLSTTPDYIADEFLAQLRPMIRSGKVVEENGVIRIPSERWLTSDSIMRDLIVSF